MSAVPAVKPSNKEGYSVEAVHGEGGTMGHDPHWRVPTHSPAAMKRRSTVMMMKNHFMLRMLRPLHRWWRGG